VTASKEIEFVPLDKIPRYFRNIIITEKIDGTNAQVHVLDDGTVLAGCRTRYVTPQSDNFGFAAWVLEHEDELRNLGPGRHYGEWFGVGIQRGYGITTRRFALFNSTKWADARPACCAVVPVLFSGPHLADGVRHSIDSLTSLGSSIAPGFLNPEGICIYHQASRHTYKVTIGDDGNKGQALTARVHSEREAP